VGNLNDKENLMAGQPEMDNQSKINKQFAKLATDASAEKKLKHRLLEEPLTVFKEYGIPVRSEAHNVIRAWKDPKFRNSLSEAERAALPPNPAGAIEISDADLDKVAGGLNTTSWFCHLVTVTSTYTHTASCTAKKIE
jgi:mersacidin/lichenicidin family type 2 lantibiotic